MSETDSSVTSGNYEIFFLSMQQSALDWIMNFYAKWKNKDQQHLKDHFSCLSPAYGVQDSNWNDYSK